MLFIIIGQTFETYSFNSLSKVLHNKCMKKIKALNHYSNSIFYVVKIQFVFKV